MSHSTEVSLDFPGLIRLSITLGSRGLAERYNVPVNKSRKIVGLCNVLDVLEDTEFQGAFRTAADVLKNSTYVEAMREGMLPDPDHTIYPAGFENEFVLWIRHHD